MAALWKRPAETLPVVRGALVPDGRLYVFNQLPGGGGIAAAQGFAERVATVLAGHGFATEDVITEEMEPGAGGLPHRSARLSRAAATAAWPKEMPPSLGGSRSGVRTCRPAPSTQRGRLLQQQPVLEHAAGEHHGRHSGALGRRGAGRRRAGRHGGVEAGGTTAGRRARREVLDDRAHRRAGVEHQRALAVPGKRQLVRAQLGGLATASSSTAAWPS